MSLTERVVQFAIRSVFLATTVRNPSAWNSSIEYLSLWGKVAGIDESARITLVQVGQVCNGM